MTVKMKFADLARMIERVFVAQGLSESGARIVAGVVAAAERDGAHSHGLMRLEGYVSTLRSGWVNLNSSPRVNDVAPGVIMADADNGFAQIACAASRPLLLQKVRQQGIATLAVRNSHHFAALWPDVEWLAEQGFIAITAVNTRSYMIVWGGKKKILGTNPMAFACPRKGHLPVVWDQASSPISHGDLLLAVKSNRSLAPGIAVDAEGEATIDPNAVLKGGAFLPFGGVKGSSIAFMIEILAAAVTGGRFGFDDRVADFPGGKTSHAGQLIIALDPVRSAGQGYFERLEEFLARLRDSGVKRLPGDRRYDRRRQSEAEGIAVATEHYETMSKYLGS